MTGNEAILLVSTVTRRALEDLGTEPSKMSVIPNGAAEVFFDASESGVVSEELEFLREWR